MSGGGGKGGQSQQTSTVKLPENIEKVAKQNLDLADTIGKIGYVPYRGNTVAALTPMQRQGMQNTQNAASAFNMSGPLQQQGGPNVDPFTGLAMNPTLTGGVLGYSPAGIYDDAVSKIPQGQRNAINSFFIDPRTGRMQNGSNPFGAGGGGGGGGGGKGGSSYGRPTNAHEAHLQTKAMRDAGSTGVSYRPRSGAK